MTDRREPIIWSAEHGRARGGVEVAVQRLLYNERGNLGKIAAPPSCVDGYPIRPEDPLWLHGRPEH